MAAVAERISLGRARQIASEVHDYLCGGAERLEIAGSIRRERPWIGDIELVALPRMVPVADGLFETREESVLEQEIAATVADGVLERLSGGDRYVKLRHRESGVQVDLFVVRPPAQWGVLFLIRTGSAAYSQRFVTEIKRLGYHVVDGALHRGGAFGCPRLCTVVDTPEEADVYEAVGLPMLQPAYRDG